MTWLSQDMLSLPEPVKELLLSHAAHGAVKPSSPFTAGCMLVQLMHVNGVRHAPLISSYLGSELRVWVLNS